MCLAHKSLDEFTCKFSSTDLWAKISGLGMKAMEATERDMPTLSNSPSNPLDFPINRNKKTSVRVPNL